MWPHVTLELSKHSHEIASGQQKRQMKPVRNQLSCYGLEQAAHRRCIWPQQLPARSCQSSYASRSYFEVLLKPSGTLSELSWSPPNVSRSNLPASCLLSALQLSEDSSNVASRTHIASEVLKPQVLYAPDAIWNSLRAFLESSQCLQEQSASLLLAFNCPALRR